MTILAQEARSVPRLTLATMRDRHRPLLLFAPPGDPRVERQVRMLVSHRADLMDRQILMVPLNSTLAGTADEAVLGFLPGEEAALRRRFHIADREFTVLLLGKDGGEKLRSHTPVTIDQLNRLIDAMPMRQQEMKSRPPC